MHPSKPSQPELAVLPLLPLRDIVVFPHMVVPLFVGRERSIAAVERAMIEGKRLLLAAQKQARVNEPAAEDIFAIGTVGQIIQLLRLPDGTVKVLVEGSRRARILRFVESEAMFVCEAEPVRDRDVPSLELEALVRGVLATFERYVKLNRRIPPELTSSVQAITEPGRLSDTIAAHMSLKLSDKQTILEMDDPLERLQRLDELMRTEIEAMLLEKKVRSRMRSKPEEPKERLLNEQMQAIQREMGERDEFKNELQELEEKIRTKQMPKDARTKARRELRKLKMMAPMSAEATVVRNYVDWIIGLPWATYSKDKLDIEEAEKILDEDHYGLDKAKERILEYLAVQALVERMKGPILCLVGPPGVGKTSLARSIARATGRKYVRLSLGGVRDEAEIRGHRRTYIGALPGKIIQSLKRAGTSNPVFLLDEVDKMSTDFRGDPSSALLEVLDPEQNDTFNDHYLDLDYDLSRVMFITTANTLHSIPLPLKDRMEVIEISGYTEFDKLNIAQKYLVPKQLEANGLAPANAEFTEAALRSLVNEYTREAGVRSLEREIASVCRKIAKEVVKEGKGVHVKVTPARIQKYLGPPRFRHGRAEERAEVGMANGLAVTATGGDLLTTEVTVMPGRGKLIITGKLGDVMQESAQAAISYVRSRARHLGLVRGFYQKIDIHIHVPEGAIPKDGPSAGITMATSLTSALVGVPVRNDVAMTGEITLRGRVLPVGGIKEKVLAAHRGGIKTVLVPAENEKDLRDIPKNVRQAVRIELVEHMDSVLRHALELADPDAFLRPDITCEPRDEVGILVQHGGVAHSGRAAEDAFDPDDELDAPPPPPLA
jgi:ATP-dependent Lon protease